MADPTDGAEGGPSGPQNERPIRVLVVDDHPVWRDGLRVDLERDGTATVVGEAHDGGQAIELAQETMPEVVIMDLHLPTVGGIDATRRIVEESPHVKVLVLSATGEEAQVLEAVQAGACGYLLKSDVTAADVVDAVRRVQAGEPVFTPSLAALIIDEFRRLAPTDPSEPRLSERENEVLHLVAKGYTYREIAEKLFIAVKTVQNHVQNILSKLQLHKRYELMRWAWEKGFGHTE